MKDFFKGVAYDTRFLILVLGILWFVTALVISFAIFDAPSIAIANMIMLVSSASAIVGAVHIWVYRASETWRVYSLFERE